MILSEKGLEFSKNKRYVRGKFIMSINNDFNFIPDAMRSLVQPRPIKGANYR
jgi:hypothetical protein